MLDFAKLGNVVNDLLDDNVCNQSAIDKAGYCPGGLGDGSPDGDCGYGHIFGIPASTVDQIANGTIDFREIYGLRPGTYYAFSVRRHTL